MKKFKFKFAAVEKVRKIETEKQMKELALAVKKAEGIENEILSLEMKLANEVHRIRVLAGQGEADAVNHLSLSYRDWIHSEIKKKRKELLEARQVVMKERRKLIDRSKDQKAIEKLREKEREKYHEELRKTETKNMDEIAGNLWAYRDL